MTPRKLSIVLAAVLASLVTVAVAPSLDVAQAYTPTLTCHQAKREAGRYNRRFRRHGVCWRVNRLAFRVQYRRWCKLVVREPYGSRVRFLVVNGC